MTKPVEIIGYSVASSGIVPIRREPSDASEMVSEILLGETATVLQQNERWLHIKTDFDHYEGWVNRSQMKLLKQDEYREWITSTNRILSAFFSYFVYTKIDALLVPPGAQVVKKDEVLTLPMGSYIIQAEPIPLKKASLLDTALQFLGVPYLWGGRTDSGIDCSGFIQTVYALHGLAMPRDSGQQVKMAGSITTNINDAKAGDLVYFSTHPGHITHVGFYLDDGLLLHASGNVKISRISGKNRSGFEYEANQKLVNFIVAIQSDNEIEKVLKKKSGND